MKYWRLMYSIIRVEKKLLVLNDRGWRKKKNNKILIGGSGHVCRDGPYMT